MLNQESSHFFIRSDAMITIKEANVDNDSGGDCDWPVKLFRGGFCGWIVLANAGLAAFDRGHI